MTEAKTYSYNLYREESPSSSGSVHNTPKKDTRHFDDYSTMERAKQRARSASSEMLVWKGKKGGIWEAIDSAARRYIIIRDEQV